MTKVYSKVYENDYDDVVGMKNNTREFLYIANNRSVTSCFLFCHCMFFQEIKFNEKFFQ